MSSEQDGPSGPGQPSSGRPRPPVTLDLKADEVRPEAAADSPAESVANAAPEAAHEAAHDAAHDAALAATAEPQTEAPAAPQSNQSRSAAPERARPLRLAGLVLGAAVGAAAGAGALLVALWYGGLAIGTGAGDEARGRLATLEAQVAELGHRPVPAPDARVGELGTRLTALERVVADLRQLEQRLAKAEAALAQPAAEGSAGSAEMTRRVAALEEATTTLASAIGELRKRLGEVAALAGSAAGGQGASLGEEIGALGKRVAALEDATTALRTAQAAPPPPDRDLAARLATAALALRAAVESGRPFGNELEAVAAIGDVAARLAPLRAFATTGVPSAETLRRELAALLPTLRQAAPVNAENMGWLERLQAGAARLVRIRRTDAPPSNQPDDVLGRVEAAAARGDLAAVAAEAAKLPDGMRATLDPWLRRATERQAALAAASDLLQSSISGLARGGQGASPR